LPGGYYASCAPFSVAFLRDTFTEAGLINYAYAFEQATQFRVPPTLVAVSESSTLAEIAAMTFFSTVVAFRRKQKATI
jgi:hypothetical protein